MKKSLKKLIKVLVAVFAVTMLCACAKNTVETVPEETVPAEETQLIQNAEQPKPVFCELTVDSIEEQDDMMVITTSYGVMKYPFAFADLIRVNAVDEGEVSSLEFAALIAEVEHPLFAIHFGGTEGILMGNITIPEEASERSVYAEFYAADEIALGEHVGTYHAAQEIFNDVAVSLTENQNFVSAQ